jgi:hypothetical protein
MKNIIQSPLKMTLAVLVLTLLSFIVIVVAGTAGLIELETAKALFASVVVTALFVIKANFAINIAVKVFKFAVELLESFKDVQANRRKQELIRRYSEYR